MATVTTPLRFTVANKHHVLRHRRRPQLVRKSRCEAPPLISISNRSVAEPYPGLCCWKSPPRLPDDEPLIVTALMPPLTATRHCECAGATSVMLLAPPETLIDTVPFGVGNRASSWLAPPEISSFVSSAWRRSSRKLAAPPPI